MDAGEMDEMDFVDENSTIMQWNMSDVVSLIETFVRQNQGLIEIKHYFFGNDVIKANSFDIAFIENVFEEKFIAMLPEKGKEYIKDMLDDQRWDEIHIWFEGIYLEKYPMWECFKRTKPPFFDIIQNIDKNKFSSFFEQIQSHFQSSFLECKFLNEKYRLFRALINCDSKTALSKTFIESLETLEIKLNTNSDKAYLLPETHIIHKEHQLFADLVNKFTADEHDIISLNLLIDKLYKNSTTIFRENGEKIFEIAGRQIVWSNVSETYKKNSGQDSISQIRLTARHMLVLDANIKYDGKNLALISPKIVVQIFVTCDLSGGDAAEIVNAKAGNGNAKNKNGEDGINGFDGASSGSIVICASEIVNPENLNIVMNGGHGSKGQDGGDGFDGENGIGKKFKKAFGFGAKIKLKTAAIGNVILGGLPGILRARYNEKIKDNGLKRLKSFSTHKWPSHAMIVYKGTKGSPGGRGGLNGLGGYGGKKGNITILNCSTAEREIKVKSDDGKNGEAGNHGKNGVAGQDGWDVACIKKSFGRFRKYGKFNNEKLEIIFTDKEDKDTVYIKSKDTGKGSHCFAKIISKPLKHFMLKENEKQEVTKRTERMSTPQKNKININSVEKTYQKLCNIASEEMKADHSMEVQRLIDRFEVFVYLPKHAIEPLNIWKDTFQDKKAWFEKSMAQFNSKHTLLTKNIDDLRNLLKPLLDKLLIYVNAKVLYKSLELMCVENISVGADFVIAFLANFENDDCRVDFGILKFLIETVFSSIKKNESFKFSSILLSTDQSEWVDAFFLHNIETAIHLETPEKAMIQKCMKNVLDENLKFVFSRWFRRFPLDFQHFLVALQSMENVIAPISVVDKTPLTEWSNVLKYSTYNSNLSIKQDDSDDLQLVKFWCSKLASFYSYEEIEETFKLLSTHKDISCDKVNISQLVHRLCIYDFVAGDFNPREEPTVKYLLNEVFACYLGISISSPSETYNVAQEVVQQFRTERSETTVTSNHLENAWEECRNNSQEWSFLIGRDSDLFCNELFEKYIKFGENWDMEDFQNQIHETQKNQLKDFDICLIKFVERVINLKFNIQLRVNQKIAILTAIRGQNSKGILQQLPTGNGKSLIIVVASIILTWKRRVVNIVTSSSVLAKRDVLQYSHYYKAFGIKVNHICDESPHVREERYENNHVLYGDLSSFQRDYLLDAFYSMKITNNRAFDRVIVDEVDSMLLDQGANMLYLSHEIQDMERLQPLFVKIWQIVHFFSAAEATDDDLYTFIYHSCFASVGMLNMMEILNLTESEYKMLKTTLTHNGILNEDEDILLENCGDIALKFEKLTEIPRSTINCLIFIFHQIMNEERLRIPFHLHKFVKFHLKEFITNAKLAMHMEEGIQYIVDMNLSNFALTYEPRIIIVDQNTGADMPSTQWSNGLQQFLQLKHCLRLTPVSLKAVYISSISYFKKFNQIYGFSGTLGSRRERQQLYDKYYVDLKLVPSSLPNLFYEEPSIITTAKNGFSDSHVNHIFEAINAKLSCNRSVLIICDSIKQVDELSAAVRNLASKELFGESASPFINAQLYRRDYEKFEYGEGVKLPCRKIIFSTSLAGRGTNIILTDDLRRNGGLHVIVAFLPKNLRIEEQAFGRAARSGDPGSGQLIICIENNCYGNLTDFLQLKLLRNAQDNHKIENDCDYYEDKVKVEEKCFEIFAKHFHEHKKEMDENEVEKTEKILVLRDLLDQWALWGDTYPNEILSPQKRRSSARKSCKAMKGLSAEHMVIELMSLDFENISADECRNQISKIEKKYNEALKSCAFKNSVSERRIAAAESFCNEIFTNFKHLNKDYILTQPANILMLAVCQIEKKKYTEAEKSLKSFATSFPIYAPEAKYYLTFLAVKKCDNLTEDKNEIYKQLGDDIEEARNEFDCRMFSNYTDRAIIEFYKESDNHNVFKADAFSQQQMELSQMSCLFIESVDAFLGGRLDAKSFITTFIPEEASYLLYQHFTDEANFKKLPIKPIKVCDDYDVQKLKEYSQKRDICFQLLSTKIESLKGKSVLEKDLIKTTNLPTAEELWESLFTNNVLISPKQHFFANIVKFETMNPALVEIIKNLIEDESSKDPKRLFKHYFVLTDNWKEIDAVKMKERLAPECIKILCNIGSFCETESAELRLKFLPNINFSSFDKITTENLLIYNIPENEVNTIFNSFTNNGVLKAIDNNTFELSDNFRSSMEEQRLGIQSCYKKAAWKAVNQNLAFSIAYVKLRQDFIEMKPLKITLPLESEYSLINDLTEIGILERSNVDVTALKTISKVEWPFKQLPKAIYQDVIISDASSANIEIAVKIVKQKCRNNLRPPTSNSEDKKIKEYKHVTADKDKISQKFIENARVQRRIDTLDVELCLLCDVLIECNLVEIKNSTLTPKDCMKYLLKFNSKKWSKKTITKLGLIFIAASAQLTIGAAIMLTTAGIGTPISKYFISQGLGDIIYIVKSCYTGYAENYIQSKLNRMILGAIPSMTWIKQLIIPSETHSSSSIDAVSNIMLNKLRNQILFASINLSILSVFHSKVDDGVAYVTSSTQKIIIDIIEKEVINIDQTLQKTFGTNDFRTVIIESCNSENFKAKLIKIITPICDFIFIHYRNFFIKIEPNMAKNDGNNKDSSLFNKLVAVSIFIKQQAKFCLLRSKMQNEIGVAIKDLITAGQEECSEIEERASKSFNTQPEGDINSVNITENFRAQVEKAIEQTINSKITKPLIALTMSKLQRNLQTKVFRNFENFKSRSQDQKNIPKNLGFKQHRNNKVVEKQKQDAIFLYEEILNELFETTTNVMAYVEIIMTGTGIDEMACKYLAKIITLKLPVNLVIKSSVVENFIYSVDDKSPDVIHLDLTDETMGTDIETSRLFNVISNQIPALAFTNEAEFKQVFVQLILNDPEFESNRQQVIMANKPITTNDLSELMSNLSQSINMFNTVSATAPGPNVLFLA